MIPSAPLLTFAEFIERLKISAPTGRRLLRAGKIGYFRVEGSIRILSNESDEYLAKRYVPPRDLRQTKPETVEQILDRVAPRRRGRPKIEVSQ